MLILVLVLAILPCAAIAYTAVKTRAIEAADPNVSELIESTDMKAAQRSYEANLNAIEAARGMTMRTIDLLK